MKINYVIATWSGKNTKRNKMSHIWNEPSPSNVLKAHLQQLLLFEHSLSQITVMMPICDPKIKLEDYYDIQDEIDAISQKTNVPIITIHCENFGYSSGQWLKSYEIYRGKFDYYIFIEDDYCPFVDNFDRILINCFKTAFSKNHLIGKLCGFVEGYPIQRKHAFPAHWSGIVVLNSITLEKLYNAPYWKHDPRGQLNKLLIKGNNEYTALKRKYIGGFNQINFSLLFSKLGISMVDYCNDYPVPFFEEETGKMYYMCSGLTSHESLIKFPIHSKNDLLPQPHPIVPIQLIYLKKIS